MHTRDLQFIEDGNKTLVNGLVNFEKQIMLGCTISEIIYQQGFNYEFKANGIIQVRKYMTSFYSIFFKVAPLCHEFSAKGPDLRPKYEI